MAAYLSQHLDHLRSKLQTEGLSSDESKWIGEIAHSHEAATTEEERVLCVQMLHNVLDRAIPIRPLDPQDLAEFQETCRQYYLTLLNKEAIIGRTDGYITPERLAAVTQREVAAGRMSPDDEMHKSAVAVTELRKPVPISAFDRTKVNITISLIVLAITFAIVYAVIWVIGHGIVSISTYLR